MYMVRRIINLCTIKILKMIAKRVMMLIADVC